MGEVILKLNFCFFCLMLLCFLLVLYLGEGGFEEGVVFMDDGGMIVLKLNVFLMLDGGVDFIIVLVELDIVV